MEKSNKTYTKQKMGLLLNQLLIKQEFDKRINYFVNKYIESLTFANQSSKTDIYFPDEFQDNSLYISYSHINERIAYSFSKFRREDFWLDNVFLYNEINNIINNLKDHVYKLENKRIVIFEKTEEEEEIVFFSIKDSNYAYIINDFLKFSFLQRIELMESFLEFDSQEFFNCIDQIYFELNIEDL